MQIPDVFGIIAGNGVYPKEVSVAARRAGVKRIVAAAFTNETDPHLSDHVDTIEWLRVGQLSRLLKFLRESGVRYAVMSFPTSTYHPILNPCRASRTPPNDRKTSSHHQPNRRFRSEYFIYLVLSL